jgi:alpha-L-fucosidase 2
MQSHNEEIELLPALPAAWPNGSVKGLRARGGFEVDIVWKNGALDEATIKSLTGSDCHIHYRDQAAHVRLKRGASVRLNGKLGRG